MNSQRGLTSIELVIVIAIIVILAGGAFVYIGVMNSMKLDAAAQKLVADIRYAQGQATATTTWHGVLFEPSPTNRYTVYQTNGTTDSPINDPSDFSKTLIVNTYDKFGVSIAGATLEGNANKIEFNGLGRPYTDYGGWVVSSEGVVGLTIGGLYKTVRIAPLTGKAEIQ